MGLPEVEAGVAPATGGAESFEAFYVREYPAVVRLAYALSGSRLVAEEADQRSQHTTPLVAEGLLKGGYQYVSLGRISTAPPRRAGGIRAASSIAASRSSASRMA